MSHEHHHPTPATNGSTDQDAPRPPKQEQEEATTDVTEVAPGVLRTQLPISLPGLGHVNCYVMEDERGIAVVDPGLPGPAAWDALVDRLGRAGYGVTDVHTVVVTHSHPDHYGGAQRLRHESGAEIVTHESFRTLFDSVADDSEDSADLSVNSFDEQIEAIERYMSRPSPWGGRRAGPNREFIERLHGERPDVPLLEPLRPTMPVVEGQTIRLARREWVAMHTPGHTYDHLCLFDPEHGVVFTGDHVLPTITPHISGMAPEADPLALFFASLERMAAMSDVTVALPAHGHPFTDLRGRSEHIIEHHGERLDIIRQASEQFPDGTVSDFMRVLFRERSWGEMAESETYAHLEHLRELGEFSRSFDDGMAHYRAIG
ncbi:MAG: MBL fold metallo-hydrolase [Ilumatobacter sp.]|nr:MBL fold metallo-hydrolase [Ilumatobacter sp.]